MIENNINNRLNTLQKKYNEYNKRKNQILDELKMVESEMSKCLGAFEELTELRNDIEKECYNKEEVLEYSEKEIVENENDTEVE